MTLLISSIIHLSRPILGSCTVGIAPRFFPTTLGKFLRDREGTGLFRVKNLREVHGRCPREHSTHGRLLQYL